MITVATMTNRQFVSLPAGVFERIKIAKLSACARDLYFYLCENQNFKSFDSRTYPRTDAELGKAIGRSEITVRVARSQLVRSGFIRQDWHKSNKKRVIGTRVFFISFDFAPPRKPKKGTKSADKVIDFQSKRCSESHPKSDRPSIAFSASETPPNPRPERVSAPAAPAPLDTLTESIKDPSPPGSPPPQARKVLEAWERARGEKEEGEIFFPDILKTLNSIQDRHSIDENAAAEALIRCFELHVSSDHPARPSFFTHTDTGRHLLRKAVKPTPSPTLNDSSSPAYEAEEATENEQTQNEVASHNISPPRPAAPRFDPAAWVDERMRHAQEARDALVRAGLKNPYTDVELREMRASLETRAAGIAAGGRRGSIQLDADSGESHLSDFAVGVMAIINRARRAQEARHETG